jgi:hypothetical protein
MKSTATHGFPTDATVLVTVRHPVQPATRSPMSRHRPRLCPNDGAPLTASGMCTTCGETFAGEIAPRSAGSEAIEAQSLPVEAPPIDVGELAELDGIFEIELLEAVPDGMVPVNAPLGSGTDVAGNLARILGGVAQEATTETVYKLVPSKELQKGLAEKTLQYASSKKGDASVLIKDVKTGTVKGHAALKQVKPNPASLLGPAAWQALAMVTQQHFLSEIDGRLERIEERFDEMLDRMRAQLDEDLRSMIKEVERLRERHEEGVLNDHDHAEIRRMLRDVDASRAQALRSFNAQMIAAPGTADPTKHFPDLETAYLAFRAQAQLAQLRVQTAPANEAALAVEQERRRFRDALPQMQDVARMLVEHDKALDRQNRRYENSRKKQGRIARSWDRTAGKAKALRISEDPPEFPPLSRARRQLIDALAEPVELTPQPLVVRAGPGGDVALLTTGATSEAQPA